MLITPPLGSTLKWHYKQHGTINSSILLMLGNKSQKKYGVINSKMLYPTGVISIQPLYFQCNTLKFSNFLNEISGFKIVCSK